LYKLKFKNKNIKFKNFKAKVFFDGSYKTIDEIRKMIEIEDENNNIITDSFSDLDIYGLIRKYSRFISKI